MRGGCRVECEKEAGTAFLGLEWFLGKIIRYGLFWGDKWDVRGKQANMWEQICLGEVRWF